MSGSPAEVTASMLVIGDEILSGRTKDANVGFVAETLTLLGIDLVEVRMVSDDRDAIVEAVNALRSKTDYLFTSGGIGSTHDDITAESISAAFGLPCIHDPRALEILTEAYAERDMEFTDSRKRMARMPEGSELIENKVSHAPGFRIGNVHVMAGVPKIMQAMMDAIVPTLKTGRIMLSKSIVCPHGEGVIGGPLGKLQVEHPETLMGSYPQWNDGHFWTEIVIRGRDEAAVSTALLAVEAMVEGLSSSASAQSRTPRR